MKQLLAFSKRAIQAAYWYFRKNPVALLLVIAVLTHLQWFNPTSTLFYSDWRNRDATAAHDMLNFSRATWITQEDMGQQNVQLYGYPPTVLWGLAGSYDLGVKIGFLWPIAILSVLAPYFLIRKLTQRKDISFICALLYGFSSYLIILTTNHLPIAVVYSLAPFIILSYLKLTELPDFRNALIFAALFSIGCIYELRIMFILSIILAFCTTLYPKILTKKWLYGAGAMILLFNLFWIIPTALGGAGGQIDSIANRGLFGDNLFTLKNALAFFAWRWTGGMPQANFIPQPVKVYFWILPIFALLAIINYRKLDKTSRRLVLFFGATLLFGLAFAKQSSSPFPELYHWFYANVPGFNLFREASKYYLAVGVGYVGLAAVALKYLTEKSSFKQYRAYILTLAALPVFFLVWPMLTGQMETMYVNRHKPEAYKVFSQKVLQDPEPYRTLWMPRTTGWGAYNDTHPRVDAAVVAEAAWKPVVDPVKNANSISPTLDMMKSPIGQSILNSASVKYVIVPIRDTQNDDDFYRAYGDNPQYFIEELSKISWLKRVNLGSKDLVVFENPTYKQRIYSFGQLASFDTRDDLSSLYAFSDTTLGMNQPGYVMNKNVPGSREVQDMFADLTPQNITKQGLTSTKKTASQSSLYVNTNEQQFSYSINGRLLELLAQKQGSLTVNGSPFMNNSSSTVIQSVLLDDSKKYFARVDDKYIPISLQSGLRYLGTAQKTVKIIETEQNSLVANGSFEAGQWQSTVEDCNDYNNKANISMNIDGGEHTDGRQSLVLGAQTHTACTDSAPIAVNSGASYLLSFDSKLKNLRDYGYEILNTQNNAVVAKQRFTTGSSQWQNNRQEIVIPAGVASIKIRLLGLPNQKGSRYYSSTSYDNVMLNQVVPATSQPIAQKAYQPQALQTNGVQAVYSRPNQDSTNLVPNFSLEKGLWQKKVGDCNAYDDKPQLRMGQAAFPTLGSYSLELSAKRHVACTGPADPIQVKENATYLISFDYQSPNGARAGYNLGFNDKNTKSLNERMDAKKQWQKFSKVITVPAGANALRLTVYAYANEYGSRYMTTRYDNFRIVQVPDIADNFYVASNAATIKPPKTTSFTQVNPTYKKVTITGASTPFYLAMNDAYHAKWRLTAAGVPSTLLNKDHFKLNDYANGWYIDTAQICKDSKACHKNADGTYDIALSITFAPQSYFYKGLFMSVTGFIVLSSIALIKRHKKVDVIKERFRARHHLKM